MGRAGPGWALVALAFGHVIYAGAAWQTGATWLFSPFQNEPAGHVATLAWFVACAPLLALMGWLAVWGVSVSGRPLPGSFGWVVVAFSSICAVVWPVSGFPVGIGLGGWIVWLAREEPSP